MRRSLFGTLGVLCVALGMPLLTLAAPFTNGSFEDGTPPGTFSTEGVGSTDITGWSVVSGSVDYIGTYWQAAHGSRSIDLSGDEQGTLAQTFDTVPGAKYRVTFALAGNPDGAPIEKSVTVSAGTTSTTYTFDATGKSLPAMGWVDKVFEFTASGSQTTLSFTGTAGTPYGPALDHVRVEVLDSDGDGVLNDVDFCPNTPPTDGPWTGGWGVIDGRSVLSTECTSGTRIDQ